MPEQVILKLTSAILIFLLTDFLQQRFLLNLPRTMTFFYAFSLSLLFVNPVTLLLGSILLVIAEIDRREFRIPDVFTKPGLFALSIAQIQSVEVLACAWGWVAIMYLLTHFKPSLVGRGDIKLIATLILASSFCTKIAPLSFLIHLLFLACLFSVPAALVGLRSGSSRHFPFGPALSAAAMLLVGVPGLSG